MRIIVHCTWKTSPNTEIEFVVVGWEIHLWQLNECFSFDVICCENGHISQRSFRPFIQNGINTATKNFKDCNVMKLYLIYLIALNIPKKKIYWVRDKENPNIWFTVRKLQHKFQTHAHRCKVLHFACTMYNVQNNSFDFRIVKCECNCWMPTGNGNQKRKKKCGVKCREDIVSMISMKLKHRRQWYAKL